MDVRRPVAAVLVSTGLVLGTVQPAEAVVPVQSMVPGQSIAKAPAYAAIWGPSTGTYGSTVTLSGYLRDATGAALRGEKVYVQGSPRNRNTWANLTTRTVPAGNFTVAVKQTIGYDYRVWYTGSPTYDASASRAHYPAVLRRVSLDSIRTTSWETGTLRVTGRLAPTPASGSPVYLQRWVPSTRSWRNIGVTRTTGRSEVTVTSRAAGSVLQYRLYAPYAAKPGPYGAGVSRTVRFQNLVWRGVFAKPLLGRGGTGNPKFSVIPPGEAPFRSEADLIAGPRGTVWGDLNTSGCAKIEAFFGNVTDGSVRVSLLRGSAVVGTATMAQQTEVDLNRSIARTPRLRMQVVDVTSGHGPLVATDTRVLCNN